MTDMWIHHALPHRPGVKSTSLPLPLSVNGSGEEKQGAYDMTRQDNSKLAIICWLSELAIQVHDAQR